MIELLEPRRVLDNRSQAVGTQKGDDHPGLNEQVDLIRHDTLLLRHRLKREVVGAASNDKSGNANLEFVGSKKYFMKRHKI
jgi:hypothetical protein